MALWGKTRKLDKLRESGTRASAVVSKCQVTGSGAAGTVLADLTVELPSLGNTPARMSSPIEVATDKVPRVGDAIGIRYDPDDADCFVLDDASTAAAVTTAAATTEPSVASTTFSVQGQPTVIDARGVPGLRDALLGAMQSGNWVDMAKMGEQIAEQYQHGGLSAWAASASAGGGESDAVAQLKKAAKLHEAGALTDEEFAALKKKLLDEI